MHNAVTYNTDGGPRYGNDVKVDRWLAVSRFSQQGAICWNSLSPQCSRSFVCRPAATRCSSESKEFRGSPERSLRHSSCLFDADGTRPERFLREMEYAWRWIQQGSRHWRSLSAVADSGVPLR